MRPSITLLAAALLLALVAAAPADAATVHRVFGASMGSAGSSGTVLITEYMDGNGRVDYALKAMHPSWTYRVEVRKGRCTSLGAVVARLTPVKVSSAGKATLGRGVSLSNMDRIWQANWTAKLAVRLISGSSIRCGNLNFTRATRVAIPSYKINLPIVRGPNGYPYCNVAMFAGALNQPTEPGVTFIFAHARTGMFLPLLKASKVNNGAAMLGKLVYVYTSNSRVHVYKIIQVRRHLKSVQGAVGVTAERLWLQTSEGPNFTYPKLVIVAQRVSSAAATFAASHPTPHIVHCS